MLFVARPLYPSESAAGYGDGLPIVMLWIALAVFWLLAALGRDRLWLRWGWTELALVLLVGTQAASTVWGVARGTPRPAINMFWEWVGYAISFFLLRQLLIGARETRAVIAIMLALTVALASHGLYQSSFEMPDRRAQYRKNPEQMLRDNGFLFTPDSAEGRLFRDRLNSTEPLATFALTNSLAGLLAPWLVVGCAIALGSWKSSREQGTGDREQGAADRGQGTGDREQGAGEPSLRFAIRWPRFPVPYPLVLAAPLVVVLACLILTKSRTAWLATLLGLLLTGLFTRPQGGRIGWRIPAAAGLVVAALLAAAVALRGLDREVVSEAGKSLGYRLQYWQATLHMIADHPLLGCGLGNFRDDYTRYKLPEASEEVADPHNFLLEVWATAGTPALLALLAVLVSFGCAAASYWRSGLKKATVPASDPGQRPPRPGCLQGDSPVGDPPATWTSEATDRQGDDQPLAPAIGLGMGFVLSLPVGLMSEGQPGPGALCVGLPIAAVCLAIFWPWVRGGRLSPAVPAIAILVLLVNLSAAGGLGFPGVAGTLWLLAAVGLNAMQSRPPRPAPRGSAAIGLVVGLSLAVACYATAYRPVLECQAAMREAEHRTLDQKEYYVAATTADPLATEPWLRLARCSITQWGQTRFTPHLEEFEQAISQAERRAPNSSAIWLAAGGAYLTIFENTGRKDAIEKAVDACRRAVELYPNSGLARARWALALRAAGDRPASRREALRALELDQITPHADKKLDGELRNILLRTSAR
jgi:hypothetical protein